MRRRVFILGAGFSAAVSPIMPVTNDLGQQALQQLEDAGMALPKGRSTYFEEWLSRLAEDQPDLTDAENLANRSLAVRLAEAIADVVRMRQTEAWASGPAEWLHRFVAVLHVWQATAISFNYDTLIEKAVDTHVLFDWSANVLGQIEHSNVLDELPPGPPGAWGTMSRRTFQLLKLHGSVNWWWVPGDASGATTNRMASLAMGEDTPDVEAERRRRLPGRTRFIVPPSALKSSYYRNPITKELWQRASKALGEADDLYLVGYSLPRTDLVIGGMLQERLREDATVTVVNPLPDAVIEQLERLGIVQERIRTIDGPGAVGDMVRALEQEASAELVDRILATQPEADIPVTIAWAESLTALVLRCAADGRTLFLEAEQPDAPYQMLAARGPAGDLPVTHADLVRALKEHGSNNLIVRFPDGKTSTLVDMGLLHREHGQASRWWALNPASPPPGKPLSTV